MKTTLEIPDLIFRRAKSVAAERGIPFRQFVTEAVQDKLKTSPRSAQKPWMKTFGKLRHLRKETARINRIIDEEFAPRIPGNHESFPTVPRPVTGLSSW